MKEAQLSTSEGPVAGNLDEILKMMKVQRQQYHGKAFIGNHVNKCLKVWRSIFKRITM